MYCTNCGHERPAGATACANCGHHIQVFAAPAAVNNYLVQSILVTLCCCLPFGVVALVFAAQVNSKLAVGDVVGARIVAAKARTWCIVGLVGGILSGAGVAALSLIG